MNIRRGSENRMTSPDYSAIFPREDAYTTKMYMMLFCGQQVSKKSVKCVTAFGFCIIFAVLSKIIGHLFGSLILIA